MSKTIPIIFDGKSLRMPLADGGEVQLHTDGTFDSTRPVTVQDIKDIFGALEPPGGGRVWWKIFAANRIYRFSPWDYDDAIVALGFDKKRNKSEYYTANNDLLIDWILKSRVYQVMSFSVFCDVRKQLWAARPHNRPRTDPSAKKVLRYAFKHKNADKKELLKQART